MPWKSCHEQSASRQVRQALHEVYDLERLLAALRLVDAVPATSVYRADAPSIASVQRLLAPATCERLSYLGQRLHSGIEVQSQLVTGFGRSLSLVAKDVALFELGFSAQLDELRGLAAGGKEWIAKYQAEQIEATGLRASKLDFNSVFGYYLEVTNTHRDKIPTTSFATKP